MTPREIAGNILMIVGLISIIVMVGWAQFYSKSERAEIREGALEDFMKTYRDMTPEEAAEVYSASQRWIYNSVLVHILITCNLLSIALVLLYM